VYKVHNKPDDHVVMQYLANSTVAEDFPYGNSKKPVNFLPSAKSLTTAMADKVTSLCSLQVATASEPEQFQPRNAQQKKYFERKSEVSADNFLVLHELAYMLPGFTLSGRFPQFWTSLYSSEHCSFSRCWTVVAVSC